MKKALMFCAVLCTAGALYGQETARQVVGSLAAGLAWGNYFDSYKTGGVDYSEFISSPGIQFYTDAFVKGKPAGIFSHVSVLFPVYYSEKEGGQNTGMERGDMGIAVQFDMLAGSAIKFELGRRFELCLGLGWHIFAAVYDITSQVNLALPPLSPSPSFKNAIASVCSMGVGLDLNFSLRITDMVFFNAGAAASMDFIKITGLDTNWNVGSQTVTISATDNLSGHFSWNIKPYLMIGFRYWQISEFGYGKLSEPKVNTE
jgi:hypothetical protein